jgi:actin-related protein
VNLLSNFLKTPVYMGKKMKNSTMLIVDFSSTTTHVYPVFEGFTIRNSSRSSNIGGESITDYLCLLISNQLIAKFSSMPIRRQRAIARDLKEKYCFVAGESFESAQKKYGSIVFEKLMKHEMDLNSSPIALKVKASTSTEQTEKIHCTVPVTGPDGDQFVVALNKERFYASEVLFCPSLFTNKDEEIKGVVELLSESVSTLDASVRNEICSNIFLIGKTSLLPGIAERLKSELINGEVLSRCGVPFFNINCLESRENVPDRSPTWQGANQRIKSSIFTPSQNTSDPGTPTSSASRLSITVQKASKFSPNEFITNWEFSETGSKVLERFLDDCF